MLGNDLYKLFIDNLKKMADSHLESSILELASVGSSISPSGKKIIILTTVPTHDPIAIGLGYDKGLIGPNDIDILLEKYYVERETVVCYTYSPINFGLSRERYISNIEVMIPDDIRTHEVSYFNRCGLINETRYQEIFKETMMLRLANMRLPDREIIMSEVISLYVSK
jgi:hypothetical protein